MFPPARFPHFRRAGMMTLPFPPPSNLHFLRAPEESPAPDCRGDGDAEGGDPSRPVRPSDVLAWSRWRSGRADTDAIFAARRKIGAGKRSNESAENDRPRTDRMHESWPDEDVVGQGFGDGCRHGWRSGHVERMGAAAIRAWWARGAMMAEFGAMAVRAAWSTGR